MRLFMAADKQCAYCDERIDGQPDPDHVIPLSRNGRNDIGNIVACCRPCNSDKSDMTLDEWALERMRLGKQPVRYVLPFTDPRFQHLTLDTATGVAWRHMSAA
jgi:5-methylcytosine-specific restriction endonuclease McrA